MPRIALSPEIIANLPIPERGKSKARVIYWDETLPRFGVEVHDSGKKLFLGLIKMGRGVEKRVMLGNAQYVAFGAAKAQALRIFEENDINPSSEDEQFETTAGRFWIAEQEGLLFPYGVFWTHPSLGQWHQKVASFRHRGRAEQYVLSETSALVDDFADPNLMELPPMEQAPVSRMYVPRESEPKRSNHLSISNGKRRYQRAVPVRLQHVLGGKKIISRFISVRLSKAEAMAIAERWRQEDDELFRRLREQMDGHTKQDSLQAAAPAVLASAPPVKPIKAKAVVPASRKRVAASELCIKIAAILPNLHSAHPGGVPTKVLAGKLNTTTTSEWNLLRYTLNRMHEEGQIQWVYVNAGGYDSKYIFAAGVAVPRPHLTTAQRRVLDWLRGKPGPFVTSYVEITNSANVATAYKVVANLAKAGYITMQQSDDDGSLTIMLENDDAPAAIENDSVLAGATAS